MGYDLLINKGFYFCVELLRTVAPYLNMTYEEINIWLFVVIHPAITVLLCWMWYNERRSNVKTFRINKGY